MRNAATSASKPARPLARLAYHSTVTCAPHASVYGKCIAASYIDVTKGMCREEFQKFKECVQEAMKKK